MAQKLARSKEVEQEVLLDEKGWREVYNKLHVEVVNKALPELERLADWRAESTKARMRFL